MLIQKSHRFTIFSVLLLFFQNLIIYWNHYFNGYFFKGDFERGFYGTASFLTTSIENGVFPHWNPFQNMGFPIFMNIQSALYYPFLWIFPLFNIQYTMNAAVIFQVVHIFFGALGMFFFLKFLFKSSRYALIGAFAFQFFGIFYTSIAFPDITRAYILTPWLFYVLTLNLNKPKISSRILFIPIVIFLFLTGAYPGNIFSTFVMILLFVILQSINRYFIDLKKLKTLGTFVVLTSLIFLGVGISIIHLGPFAEHSDQIGRSGAIAINYSELSVDILPSLFMPSKWTEGVGEAWTMSFYVTLPVLILASFMPISSVKKYWVFLVLFSLGFLMASGKNSPLFELAGMIFSPLNLSRLPIADYKIFVMIPLVIFAIEGLKSIVQMKINFKQIGFRVVFILSWFSILISLLYIKTDSIVWGGIKDLEVLLSFIILVTMIGFISYYVFRNRPHNFMIKKNQIKISLVFVIFLILIISIDGVRVIYPMERFWMGDSSNPNHSQYLEYNFPLEKDGKVITYSIFENLPEERPERIKAEHPRILSWVGQMNGSYMMTNYGSSNILHNRAEVMKNDEYRDYMMMKWTPIFLDVDINNSAKVDLPKDIFTDFDFQPMGVRQTHYGLNEINYVVSLEKNYLMIENEMYFSGWKAFLIYPNKQIEIESIMVNDIFRGWVLPMGNYKMVAQYEPPNLIVYQILSISSFLVWITIIIIYWKRLQKPISN